jgi:glycosidase
MMIPRRSGWRSAVLGAALCVLAASPVGAGSVPHKQLRALTQWQSDWWRGAVFYEIFSISWADSDGDGTGDLQGIIDRLDYLNDGDPATNTDLGVDAIWLTPIFTSPSYHGYDVSDYENVNQVFGSNDDFVRLCDEAHRRGIKVILDFVMNHTSSEHPWFVDAASSPSSPHRDWYLWSPFDLGWRQPWDLYSSVDCWHRNPADGWWYYGVFWGGMPDLNYDNPAVVVEMKRLAKMWLDRGADGFRLDAARYILETGSGPGQQDTPGTHAFWRDFAAYVRSVKPEATLVSEVWADTSTIASYYGSTAVVKDGDQLPMSFDFPLSSAIITGVTTGNGAPIAYALSQARSSYPSGANDAPFLTNHDQIRIATQLANNSGRLRNAAAILLTVPGTPFIYYGEELGLQNGGVGSDDLLKRTPMPWNTSPGGGFTSGTPWQPFAPGRATANVAVELGDPTSSLTRYRSLIKAHHDSAALRTGDLILLSPTGSASALLAFLRTTPTEQVLVVHNLSDSYATGGPYRFNQTTVDATLFADPQVGQPYGPAGSWQVNLPPRGTGVWRVH